MDTFKVLAAVKGQSPNCLKTIRQAYIRNASAIQKSILRDINTVGRNVYHRNLISINKEMSLAAVCER